MTKGLFAGPLTRSARRDALLGLTASAGALLAAAAPTTIGTHVHLFDPRRVPYAPDAPYKPGAYTLENHLKLVEAVGLAHSIIVHPEPYQDDHRYLEYCLAHEPRSGCFKSTCLFDPLREDTPRRMRALAERWPKRIVTTNDRLRFVSKAGFERRAEDTVVILYVKAIREWMP